jgi:TDG/mug DNA glycosylase family protein
MGTPVETLADLFPPSPRAVCVGVNPAPTSVAAGHYFQGRQGQRFFTRLKAAGLLRVAIGDFEDDAAVRAGLGFTDIVKRPTARAAEVTAAERTHGAALLANKLATVRPPVLIFPFKDAAVALVGSFTGNGWLPVRFSGAELFVMPGPYEAKATADLTVASLAPRMG